jgi:hypothetical protein
MKKVYVLKTDGVDVQFGIFHNLVLYTSHFYWQNREIWDVTHIQDFC